MECRGSLYLADVEMQGGVETSKDMRALRGLWELVNESNGRWEGVIAVGNDVGELAKLESGKLDAPRFAITAGNNSAGCSKVSCLFVAICGLHECKRSPFDLLSKGRNGNNERRMGWIGRVPQKGCVAIEDVEEALE